MTVSLVDVAPSVIRQLKVASAARNRIGWSSSGDSSASVVRKASIVAMFGASIPQPLAIPPTRNRLRDHRLLGPRVGGQDALGRVAMAVAAERLAEPRNRGQDLAHRQAETDQAGRADQHVALSQPTAAAAASHIASASARPLAPVPALALPLLTITPDAMPAGRCSRSRLASTGGARNLLWVKTAAAGTGLPSSVASGPCRGGRA